MIRYAFLVPLVLSDGVPAEGLAGFLIAVADMFAPALSIAAAAWAITSFVRRTTAYGPLLALAFTSLVSLVSNLGDSGDDTMTVLEAIALAARAIGFAVSLYTIFAWRSRPTDTC